MIIAAKIPFTRPAGYFCEMLKTEEHMGRVASKQAEQKEAAKAAELARKQRENRKYGKKIQIAREQEKAAKVSEEKRKLNLLRKRKPARTEDEFGVEVDDEVLSDREDDRKKRQAPRVGGKRAKGVTVKRQARNEKYGFGGRKRGLKRNDKKSFEADGFDSRKNRQPFPGMGKKKTMNRPGKQRRQQMRNNKKPFAGKGK